MNLEITNTSSQAEKEKTSAALVTLIAIRISGKPPDPEHLYGHCKIENFSALIETFLLLATSVWIIYESLQRLFLETVEVDASFWAFLVMGVEPSAGMTVHTEPAPGPELSPQIR